VSQYVTDIKKRNGIFWGWYVVFGSFAIMIISYGVRYSFGVFVKPMLAEYHWPMTIIQLGASINLILYACTGVFTGWLLDRIAPRWVMIAGILATSAGLIMGSFINTPLGLYLSYGVLVGAGTAGCGMVVTSVAIGKWFDRYRGIAIGISSMGIGVGTMLMAPLAGYLVKYYGWRNGFLIIGLIMLTVGILVSYFFMGKYGPTQIGLLPDGDLPGEDINYSHGTVIIQENASLKPVLNTLQFWILVFCNVCAVMTVMMTFNLQIAYAIHNGINELEAAAALGIIGISGSCGKFFFGWLSDRLGDAKFAASAGFGIMAVGMFILYQAQSVSVLYGYALVYGFGYGSLAPVMPYMISEHFGRKAMGAAYGLLIFFATGLGGSIGPVLGGFIYDKTGSFDLGWLICMVALVIVAVVVLALKPTPSSRRQL
jgi:MFS family permease